MELLSLVNELTNRGFEESFYKASSFTWEIHVLKKNGLIISLTEKMMTIDFKTVSLRFSADEVSYANNTISIRGAGTIRI